MITSGDRAGSRTQVSIVVPVYNEEESIPLLLEEIVSSMRGSGRTFEVILVDDGSTDGSWAVIESARRRVPELVGVKLLSNRGQTPALMAGLDASRGEAVVTMDGDLQNDPADIPNLLDKLDEGFEIVSGWRKERRDKLLSRRFPSVVANGIARRITGSTIHDNGCALKAYRGDLVRSVDLYSDFHRFIVPLAQMGGARVAEVVTHHRSRQFGKSKYGLDRVLKVTADLVTLVMVTRYSDRLMLWFLLFAVPFLFLALGAMIWTFFILFADPTSSILVPMGSCMLLFQAFCGIVGYGLFAEKARLLGAGRRTGGERTVAEIMTPQGRTAVMIKKNRLQRLSTTAIGNAPGS